MKRFDHSFEFGPGGYSIRSYRIALVRREEVQRHVTPVIAFVWVMLKDRHQLYCGDSKLLQVWNLFDHAGEGPALLCGNTRVVARGKTSHVHLINDRV